MFKGFLSFLKGNDSGQLTDPASKASEGHIADKIGTAFSGLARKGTELRQRALIMKIAILYASKNLLKSVKENTTDG